jgi:hypothetical protein
MRVLPAPARPGGRRGLDAPRLLVLLQGAALAALTKKSGEEPLTPQQRVV